MYKLYPIGTKIRYLGSKYGPSKRDAGKHGVIVGHRPCNCSNSIDGKCPDIYLPDSLVISPLSTLKIPVTWGTSWSRIEIVSQKNEQLLFSFMSEME